jgi:hypothetical protein
LVNELLRHAAAASAWRPTWGRKGRTRDDAPIPPTLAQVQGNGVDVFCRCNRCHHHAVLPVAVLIAHCGPTLPFPMIAGLTRSLRSGSSPV